MVPGPRFRALLLVIEEEAPLRRYLRSVLLASGYRVRLAAAGREGLLLAGRLRPDLVVLDLDLAQPGPHGLVLARDLRLGSRVPIIAVSAGSGEADKIRALDLGLDDYLTKPFGAGELVARIRVALRRSVLDAGAGAPVQIGPLRVDLLNREVTRDGLEVHLTPNEFALLALLARHLGRVVSHQELLREILRTRPPSRPETLLRTHLANLRRKLEPDPTSPRLLVTRLGQGYCLKGSGSAAAV